MNALKTTFLTIFCAIFAVGTLSSCLGDGDSYQYTGPTQEEKHQACLEVSGTYTGKLHFQDVSNVGSQKEDSVDVRWSVLDSTLVMDNFPVSVLSKYIYNASVKSTVAQAPTMNLVAKFPLAEAYTVRGTNNKYYQFYLLPFLDKEMKCTFSFTSTETDATGTPFEKNNTATITFVTDMTYMSTPLYAVAAYQTITGKDNVAKKQLKFNLLISEMSVNNVTYTIRTAFGVVGTKSSFSETE